VQEQPPPFQQEPPSRAEKSDSAKSDRRRKAAPASSAANRTLPPLADIPGAKRASMPTAIYPMLATAIEEPFDNPDWMFEIKWDGYRAIAFIDKGRVQLVSRNQNDLTGQYPDLSDLPESIKAKTAVLDGEIVVLDENGRPSFSLMQQRTGFRERGRRAAPKPQIPIMYYAFDVLFVDGYDLRRVSLDERKRVLESIVTENESIRLSGHFPANGKALFEIAREKGLEGIVAKRNGSCYEERRSREWLKIKIKHQLEAVIGGYTEPEGSRPFFGSIVLGLYDKSGNLVHVGQAGSGFTQMTLASMWRRIKPLESKTNPFHGRVEALRKVHWIKPELVAQIEFTEWTHATDEGGPKLRAPVFLGLREDKDPKECTLTQE